MTEDEIVTLIASGDAVKHEDGSVRWASGNSQDKQPGALVVRPPTAAPIITAETGAELAKKRQEARRQAIEDGFVAGISKASGKTGITSDEAVGILVAKMAEAGYQVTGRDAMRAIQQIVEVMGLAEKKEVVVDQRKQIIEIDNAEFNMMRGWGELPGKRDGDS
jgi:hypothetical protein